MKEYGQRAHVLWDYMLMKHLIDESTEKKKHEVVISWSCLDRNIISILLGGEALINSVDKNLHLTFLQSRSPTYLY